MTETLPQLAAALDALLHHAALSPLDDLGWLRVTGEDRVRWLNGMVTNSINDLAPGVGNYNFVLNAQGRIQGDLSAFAEPGALALRTTRSQIPALLSFLGRFIIMDDVELTDATPDCAGLGVFGPQAASFLEAMGLSTTGLAPLGKQATTWRDAFVVVLHDHSPLIPRYELWSTPETIAALSQALPLSTTTPEAVEALRLLEGTPRYGIDIRDRDLPQETAQTHALHFAKGCYLGQEIVERIRSRGQVHRTLYGFRLEGPLPSPGTPIHSEAKPVGELTSVAAVPLASGIVQLALGTIRREALATPLTYLGGTAHPIALPYPSI